jgi:hypothetical protein
MAPNGFTVTDFTAKVRRQTRPHRRYHVPPDATRIDRDYEALRINMEALFDDLGIAAAA